MKNSREERIKELVLLIAGYEEAIRMSMENRDFEFANRLKPLKLKVYEKLRRVAYGLPEEATIRPEEEG